MQSLAHIDLTKLARTLAAQRRHADLVWAITKVAAVGSTREDLRGGATSLRLIQEIVDRSSSGAGPFPPGHEETTITGALFTEAVILYARATTTGGDRPKLLGEAKLTSDQRAVHEEAVGLRNAAVAHFGRGESLPDGPLVREAVVVSLFWSEEGSKTQIGVYTTRAQHKVAFAARLVALIEVRLEQLADRQQSLFEEADRALDEALRSDPALRQILRDHEFDVDAFCASPETAAALRSQLTTGLAEDLDYAVRVRRP